MVNGAEVNENEFKEGKYVCYLWSNISVYIHYFFTDCTQLIRDDCVVEVSIILLECVVAWVATVLACYKQKSVFAGHREEVYADAFEGHLSEVVSHLIWREFKFLQIWEPEEMELHSQMTVGNSREDRKRRGVSQLRWATNFVMFLSVIRFLQVSSLFV